MARTVIGLDIGTTGVRAAEFSVGRRKMSLKRFAMAHVPEGAVHAGMIVDPEAVSAALRELWSRGKFSSKAVVLGVANDAVLVRQMDLDWMPPADFRKALRYQVADALPVPVDEANLDYYMLDEIVAADGPDEQQRKTARVMLVAAGRDMVDTFVRAAQAAGLRPVGVDLLPFALVRTVTPVQPGPADPRAPVEAVIDIGADNVVVVVHQEGRPRFVRTLPGHGGDAITRHLMERYEWTWEEAERTKIALGLPGHARPDVSAHVGPQPPAAGEDHPAHQAIAEQVHRLVTELRATLDYFRTSTEGEQPVSRLVITGRGAALGGLSETLGDMTGLPVERLTVLDRLRKPRRMLLVDDQQTGLAVPAGLCFGAVAS